MKVTQEKLPASQIGLEIEIPAETANSTYEKVVKEIARNTNIPGFRKGKVPRPILLQRLGSKRIKAAVLEQLVQDTFQKAVEEQKIESIGNYQLRSNFDELVEQYEIGQPFIYQAAVDVAPEVTLGQYQDLKIQAEEVVYNSEDVDNLIARQQERLATLIPIEDRAAQLDDIVVIDFVGRNPSENEEEEGDIIPNTEAKEYQTELKEDRFIPGFVAGIVGMNLNETKKLNLTFPEDYGQEDLAGKPVIFTITLKEIKERELPELDDDFAQEASNDEFKTFAELKESLEKQYQEKAENDTKQNIYSAIIEELLKHTTIDLPQTLMEEEIQTILMQTARQIESYGMDVKQFFTRETVSRMRETAASEASKNLHSTLILENIAQQESITLTDEEIEAKKAEIRESLKQGEVDEEKLDKFVKEDLLADKTLEWLREKNEIELVPQGTLTKEEETSDSEAESTGEA
jgi:trigger factor